MIAVHIAAGVLAMLLTALAAGWGGWCWWRTQASDFFWLLLRAAQASVVLEAGLGGVLLAMHHRAVNLHYIYGVLPILVSFIAEQLRISSAQMIMDSRGFGSAQEVGELPAEEQRELVVAVVRREIGVMALAAAVMLVLLARAAMVVH